jgi:uncharacterized coiled-coil DUF342 family protein
MKAKTEKIFEDFIEQTTLVLNKIQELRDENDELSSEIEDLEEGIENYSEEIVELQEKISSLEDQIDSFLIESNLMEVNLLDEFNRLRQKFSTIELIKIFETL